MDDNTFKIRFNKTITIEPSNIEDYYIIIYEVCDDWGMLLVEKDSIEYALDYIQRIDIRQWLTKTYTFNS